MVKLPLVRKISKNITLWHKFCMKNNPKYVRPLKIHTLLDQINMNVIHYSRYARTVLNCEKDPFYVKFWTSLIPPLDIQLAPPGHKVVLIDECKKCLILVFVQ